MTDDLTALRALAEKATPGKWWIERDAEEDYEHNVPYSEWPQTLHGPENSTPSSWAIECGTTRQVDEINELKFTDAEFIAAANPSVVLALLDRLERAEAAIANLKEWLEENRPLRCTIDYASEGESQDDYAAIMAVLAALDTGKETGE